jgi:hypothetical protein
MSSVIGGLAFYHNRLNVVRGSVRFSVGRKSKWCGHLPAWVAEIHIRR